MAKSGSKKKQASKSSLITDNRKARFSYEFLEQFEAGVMLQGTEVKSIRNGHMSLADGYCRLDAIGGEIWVHGVHIGPYSHGTFTNHEALRPRKLLMGKQQILRLGARCRERGLTVVPVRSYWKRGLVKIEVALAKGRKVHDKKQHIKERDLARDAARSLSNLNNSPD